MSTRLTPIIIFVRRFERCLKFYQGVFGLKPVRIYRGGKHPRWAEFQVGEVRLALHGGYSGRRLRSCEPLALHFEVKDIRKVLRKIDKHGGKIKRPLRKVDRFPESQLVYAATFADPDGNELEVQQVLNLRREQTRLVVGK